MRYEDYHANIIVDGRELDEYAVLIDEAEETATCYIPSQAGKNFSVRWTCLAEYREEGSKGIVTVDGVFCGASTIHTGERGRRDTAQRHHVAVDDKTVRQFAFAELATTDDDSHIEAGNLNDIGEIRLEVRRGRLVPKTHRPRMSISTQRDRRRRDRGPEPADFERPRVVHEQSKKALSHCVRFNSTSRREPISGPSRPEYALCESQPRIFFVFRYRSLEVLQAQGFAPRPSKTVIPPPRVRPRISENTSNDATSTSYIPTATPQPIPAAAEEDEDSDIEIIEVRYPDAPGAGLDEVQSRIKILKDELIQLEARQAQAMIGIKQEVSGFNADIDLDADVRVDAEADADTRPAKRVKHELGASTGLEIIVIDD